MLNNKHTFLGFWKEEGHVARWFLAHVQLLHSIRSSTQCHAHYDFLPRKQVASQILTVRLYTRWASQIPEKSGLNQFRHFPDIHLPWYTEITVCLISHCAFFLLLDILVESLRPETCIINAACISMLWDTYPLLSSRSSRSWIQLSANERRYHRSIILPSSIFACQVP
jgi:hypothetical protein